MGMFGKIMVFLFVIFISQATITRSELFCEFKNNCERNEIDVVHLSSIDGGHAELPAQSYYAIKLCCRGFKGLNSTCPIGLVKGPFLRLQKKTNSHVSYNDASYTYPICLYFDGGVFECFVKQRDYKAKEDEKCLVSISAYTNAHIANCSVYENNIWCKPVYTPEPYVLINHGDKYTSSLTVNVLLKIGYDDFSRLTKCILHGDFKNSPLNVACVNEQEIQVELTEGEGEKNLVFEVVDRLGNAKNASSSILLDQTPPSSTLEIAQSPYTVTKNIDVFLSGSDELSGLKCYNVYYRICPPEAECTAWKKYKECTDKVSLKIDLEEIYEGEKFKDMGGTRFEFRSNAVDQVGNVEPKLDKDSNTTVFIPRFVKLYTKTSAGLLLPPYYGISSKNDVIIYAKALEDNVNVKLYWKDESSESFNEYDCGVLNKDEECNVKVKGSDYKMYDGIKIFYHAIASKNDVTERNPPTASWYFLFYNHTMVKFSISGIKLILGNSIDISVIVRNIKPVPDKIKLMLYTSSTRMDKYVSFVSSEKLKCESHSICRIYANPLYEDKIYVRIRPMLGDFNVYIDAISEKTGERESDKMRVAVVTPKEFSGLTNSMLVLLFVLSLFIYVLLKT